MMITERCTLFSLLSLTRDDLLSLTPDEGSPPRPVNQEQLIEEEHTRELPDTLTIIRDVIQMDDNDVATQAEMTKEELVQEMIWIGSTGRPAHTYQISRQRRGHMHHRQQS